jgi:xanthine dehydrogenase YagR molybdenum-binding subunit
MHEIAVSAEDSAVEVLREGLGLTGTKLVCGDGVCGACTILVDGTPMASCMLPAAALHGRAVTTIEAFRAGLHPVQRAFITHDALQCGYCTPGFVVEAIAFHDRWRSERGATDPGREEVVLALSGHLCRCGAYVGIIAAVRAACAGRFDDGRAVGPRAEAADKVTGRAIYTADVRHPRQLEGAILRSPHAHANVKRIDLSAAHALPGVRAAIDLLEGQQVVRYVGQEIAAVAAVDRKTAKKALTLIRVEYEPLPAVVGMDNARAKDAPRVYRGLWPWPCAPNASEGPPTPSLWCRNIHDPWSILSQWRWLARGLVARARWRHDPLLIEGRWRTDIQVHTAFEPHACVARWSGERLEVCVSTQAAAHVAQQIARRFGLAPDNVHVIAEHVGGGFGAKLNLTEETVAAIGLAREAAAPVRVVLDRHEEMTVGGYRPGAQIDLALLASRSKGLKALQIRAYADAGVAVGSQIALFARMIYPAWAKELFDYEVVSNLPPGKPFRGPSGPVTAWALEQAVDEAAVRLGEDPITLRRRWDRDPLRQRLYGWAQSLELWRNRPPAGSERGRYRRGVGVAAANWLYFYQKDCRVKVGVDKGRLYVATAVQDPGTGIRSVLADAVARTLGMEPAEVEVRIGDTRLPRGPISSASRSTATLVPAAIEAAARLRTQLENLATERGLPSWKAALAHAADTTASEERPEDVYLASNASRPFAGTGLLGLLPLVALSVLQKVGVGRGYTGAVHVTEVEVDIALGKTRVVNVAAGIAAGRIAVPQLARSQCYGGVIQGIGYALYEHREVDMRSGIVLSAGLEDYRIPGIGDVPEIEVHFDKEGFEHVSGGGVGLGELCTLGMAASIGNAVYNATGWRPYELPIRPDRLLEGLAS